MNHDDVVALLRRRSALNSQPYGPDTIDVWAEALADIDAFAARKALLAAHLEHGAVSIKALRDHLPKRPPETPALDGQPFRKVPVERVHQLLADGIVRGRAERPADLDAAARIAAWRSGDDAAYVAVLRRQFPTTVSMPDPDLRRRMAAIPPLPGYGTNRPQSEPDEPTAIIEAAIEAVTDLVTPDEEPPTGPTHKRSRALHVVGSRVTPRAGCFG
jgi:hypothetical protein